MYKVDILFTSGECEMIIDGEEFTLSFFVDHDTGAVTGSFIFFSKDSLRKEIGEKTIMNLIENVVVDLRVHRDELSGVTFFTGYVDSAEFDIEEFFEKLEDFLRKIKLRHYLN